MTSAATKRGHAVKSTERVYQTSDRRVDLRVGRHRCLQHTSRRWRLTPGNENDLARFRVEVVFIPALTYFPGDRRPEYLWRWWA